MPISGDPGGSRAGEGGATAHAFSGIVAEGAAAGALYAVATFVLLYPLFLAPGSTIFDPAIRGGLSLFALGDIFTVIWVMTWDAHALWENPAGLFDANIFHPAPNALTSSEHMLGHMPIFGPVYAATGNPVLANQVNLFATLTLSGVSMYVLLRHWGAGRLASFAAGCIFAYCPLRLTFVTHVHLIAGQYLVFSIVALDRFIVSGRKRWAAAFAILVALQCLCSFYLAYMSLVALAAYGAAVLVGGGFARRGWRVIVAAGAGAAALVPFVLLALPYLAGRQAGTLPDGQELDLLRYLSVRLDRLFTVREEGYYVGLSVAMLALLGVIPRAARASDPSAVAPVPSIPWARAGAAAIAVVCIAFSMGPAREVWSVTIPSPYDWASWAIPGFSAMRGPIRFVLIVMVGLAALAGLGFDRLTRWARPIPGAGSALVVAAFAIVAWDYALLDRHFPVRPAEVGATVAPVYRALAELPPGPVVEIPAGGRSDPIEEARESAYTFRSIYHWQRLLNGRTGYVPPSYAPLMALARALPDERALVLLQRAAGLRYVVVHFEHLSKREWSRWRETSGLRRVRRYGDSVLFEVTEEIDADLTAALLAKEPSTSVLGNRLVALAPDQRRARVRIEHPPEMARARLPLLVEVTVTNTSDTPWPAFSPADAQRVRLGYRWRDTAGAVVAESVDADRLPYDLHPGESARVQVFVPVELPLGESRLSIGVTQEEEWFAGASDETTVKVVAFR